MSETHNKAIVRRLIADVMNGGNLDAVDSLYVPAIAADTKRWIAPFQQSFPDMHMAIVDLIAEGNKVAPASPAPAPTPARGSATRPPVAASISLTK